jgi:hypothetical protein
MIKGELRAVVQQLMDDPDGKRWSAANLDILIGMVLDDMWSEVLEQSPWFLSILETVSTLTSPGYIDTASGGDLAERIFRVQKITRHGDEYSKVVESDVVIEDAAQLDWNRQVYWWFEDQIWLAPFETTPEVEIRYSYRPTNFNSLATDGTAVVWPDGHEMVMAFRCAGMGMLKAAAEDPSPLLAVGDRAFSNLKAAIRRRQIGPMVINAMDTSHAWGSVD